MAKINHIEMGEDVMALNDVPGWVGDPRQDLLDRLNSGKKFDPRTSHSFDYPFCFYRKSTCRRT